MSTDKIIKTPDTGDVFISTIMIFTTLTGNALALMEDTLLALITLSATGAWLLTFVKLSALSKAGTCTAPPIQFFAYLSFLCPPALMIASTHLFGPHLLQTGLIALPWVTAWRLHRQIHSNLSASATSALYKEGLIPLNPPVNHRFDRQDILVLNGDRISHMIPRGNSFTTFVPPTLPDTTKQNLSRHCPFTATRWRSGINRPESSNRILIQERIGTVWSSRDDGVTTEITGSPDRTMPPPCFFRFYC